MSQALLKKHKDKLKIDNNFPCLFKKATWMLSIQQP